MAIEGPLRELALSDVLQLLALSRKTGELTVRRDGEGAPISVFLEHGAVVGAAAAGRSRRLGELLLLAGKVTERQVAAAAEEQRRSRGTLLGAVLVARYGVAADDVRRQLRFQVEELVFDLSRWSEGHFRFEERPPLDWGPVTIRLATESLLMESARRVDELAAIQREHTAADPVPRLANQPGAGAPLDLQPLDWEVLAAVDGERDLREIARELGRGEFEVAKSVFSLVSDGVLALAKRRAERGEAARDELGPAAAALREGRAEDAERLIAPSLANGASGAAFLLAGRVAGARGRWGEALARLEQAVAADPLLAPAHCALGVAAVRSGDLARAEEALRTCLRLPEPAGERESIERLARAVAELRASLAEVEG